MRRFVLAFGLLALLATGCVLFEATIPADPQGPVLSVMTYNTHNAVGMDDEFDLDRLAGVVNDADPDLIGMQEVDRNTLRHPVNMPSQLGQKTGRLSVYGKSMDYQNGAYGNLILTKVRLIKQRLLRYKVVGSREPRSASAVLVQLEGRKEPIWFVTTHLGLDAEAGEQLEQGRELLSWLDEIASDEAIIVTGDLNRPPDSELLDLLRERFRDLWSEAGEGPGYTWRADDPSKRIDYVLISRNARAKCREIRVLDTQASDHRPVLAKIQFAE